MNSIYARNQCLPCKLNKRLGNSFLNYWLVVILWFADLCIL